MHRSLENHHIIYSSDNCRGGLNSNKCEVVGSCNGLLCFFLSSRNMECYKYWFCLWNLVPGTRSIEFGTCYDYDPCRISLMFAFGYDILPGTYKVVEFREEQEKDNNGLLKSQVRVLSLDDDCWRNINTFLMLPWNSVMHLSGAIYWLAMQTIFYPFYDEGCISHVDELVILSLDLSTEIYIRFLKPSDFHEVPYQHPTLRVLLDRLCFSHDFKKTEFVTWQMKEFGVQES